MKDNDKLEDLVAQLLEERGGDEKVKPWEDLDTELPKPFDPEVSNSTFGQLRQLAFRHHRIIALAATGMKGVDIAKVVGVTPTTVYSVLKSPVAQDQMALYKAEMLNTAVDLKEHMEALGPLAVSVLEESMLNGDHRTRFLAAKESIKYLLAQAGTTIRHQHDLVVTAEDLDLMRKRAKELAPPNMVEEAHFEVLPTPTTSNLPATDQ